jgi:hypothetical protein
LTCKEIGEGVYGEVFLSAGQQKSVLKVIPIEGDVIVNGEPQKKFGGTTHVQKCNMAICSLCTSKF